MFSGREIVTAIERMQVTHVIWIPDSTLGVWERELESSSTLQLVRVCREGEAWPLAAGLYLGGMSPIVLMQCTGLFESGDALRNVVHDLKLPIFAVIGIRNWTDPTSTDSARRFAEPIVSAWGIDFRWVVRDTDLPQLEEWYAECRREAKPGLVLLAEGQG
jgi:sulfopyruvate decarboxylase TPP-binding subunit